MWCQRTAADGAGCTNQSTIIIFTCAASRCLESAVIVYRSHLRRSGTVDLRFKMIIFKSCPIGPDRLHTACSCALCRARCLELRLPFVTVEHSCQAYRVWQLRSTAFGHESFSAVKGVWGGVDIVWVAAARLPPLSCGCRAWQPRLAAGLLHVAASLPGCGCRAAATK